MPTIATSSPAVACSYGQFAFLGHHDELVVHAGRGVSHSLGVVGADSDEVAKPAVRSDVRDLGAVERREAVQGTQLVQDIVLNFGGSKAHVAPTEATQVREARMSPDAYSAANAFGNSGGHDVRVTGMEPACDIGA